MRSTQVRGKQANRVAGVLIFGCTPLFGLLMKVARLQGTHWIITLLSLKLIDMKVIFYFIYFKFKGKKQIELIVRVGLWEQGKRSGFGTFHYLDGARYVGSWVNNLKHGRVC